MNYYKERDISVRDKKLSRLRTLSQISYNEMNDLNKAVKNIYSSMNKAENDSKIIKQLSQSALETSQLLKNAIDVNQYILNKFGKENDDNLHELDIRDVKKTVFNRSKIRLTKKDYNTKNIELYESFDSNNSEYKEYKKDIQKYEQILKLHQLKGEILLNEQKKKYNLKHKFEEMKEYPRSHFMRSQKNIDNSKYKYILSSSASNSLCTSTKNNKSLHFSYIKRSNPINQSFLNEKQRMSLSLPYKKKQKIKINECIRKQTNLLKSRSMPSLGLNRNKKRLIHKRYSQQILSYIDQVEKDLIKENQSFKQLENEHNHTNTKTEMKSISKLLTQNNTINNTPKKKQLKLPHNKKNKIRKPEPLFEGINEDNLVKANAKHVHKYLDKKGKALLDDVVNQIIYERIMSITPNDKCSLYQRKEVNNKFNESFKKVCQQTLIIKNNCLVDGVLGDIKSQNQLISNICKNLIYKSNVSDDSNKFVLHKTKLFIPKSNVYGDHPNHNKKNKIFKKSISYIDINNK